MDILSVGSDGFNHNHPEESRCYSKSVRVTRYRLLTPIELLPPGVRISEVAHTAGQVERPRFGSPGAVRVLLGFATTIALVDHPLNAVPGGVILVHRFVRNPPIILDVQITDNLA